MQGGDIVLQTTVEDENGVALADVIVTIAISGPESLVLTARESLTGQL